MAQYVQVRCTVIVDVEVPDQWDEEAIKFSIEENGCPGTNNVGAAIYDTIAESEKSQVCWACALQGENEVLSIRKVH